MRQERSIVAYCTARIAVDANGCWIWTGPRRANGYGIVKMAGEWCHRYAHRVIWSIAVGPIPPTYDVHHRCRVKACVNPRHLECLPHADHVGADSRATWHVREFGPHIGVCHNGHVDEYRVYAGRRWAECKGCKRDTMRANRLKVRGAR